MCVPRLEQAVETATAGKTSAETSEQAAAGTAVLLLLLWVHALRRWSLLVVHLLLGRVLALGRPVALAWRRRAVVLRRPLVVVALLVAAVGLLGCLRLLPVLRRCVLRGVSKVQL